ncbi:MAG TPA: hypothetical protein VGT24_03330 [Candidatus Acidoferrales bacterium]|nr:hypothetical protein [Candidatus Acidoferrales bacterium]
MQLNMKWMIMALAGVASIAAVALLAIFLMRQTTPTQPAEMSQAAANVTGTTADPNESRELLQEAVAVRKPDVSREASGKHADMQSTALESGEVTLASDLPPLDYITAVPTIPSSTASVEESADSVVPVSETGEPINDQSVFASPQVPEESYVSTHFSGRASILLAEIQREAAALRLHAEVLGTYAWNPQRHWKSHAFYLDRVKVHINAVGERTAELQRISYAVLPWQQQAISEVTSHAAQVATSTQAAIIHLRENRDRLHFASEYREHLKTIDGRSEDMKQTVDKFLDYEGTQQKLQQLRNELEL